MTTCSLALIGFGGVNRALAELIRYAVRWEEAHIEAKPQRGRRE